MWNKLKQWLLPSRRLLAIKLGGPYVDNCHCLTIRHTGWCTNRFVDIHYRNYPQRLMREDADGMWHEVHDESLEVWVLECIATFRRNWKAWQHGQNYSYGAERFRQDYGGK